MVLSLMVLGRMFLLMGMQIMDMMELPLSQPTLPFSGVMGSQIYIRHMDMNMLQVYHFSGTHSLGLLLALLVTVEHQLYLLMSFIR
uniref:Uncharacterized protein n=1 Tax=Rhizophora mucronata TaxID=61149 RepID=A0A2P2LK20_RHIMU